ncbi:MAG: DUF4982 domain-containing protein [Bacteroides sp.]|nr:DUF4982 domain-containing protein [Roseburia sp.]MCM1346860.1 DUF4982 domain-containing protein [Bacteroides sp.]MCM1420044.1 DUF4982 domain-containing protein [Bacteroides sp.]
MKIKDSFLRPAAVYLLATWGFALGVQAQRQEVQLKDNWKFSHSDHESQANVDFDDKRWSTVSVPHDWAIFGPFDKEIDKQVVAIEQNGEKVPTEKTGRSGSLPWIGCGWYRTKFSVPAEYERAILNFDGAMSEPTVYVNGKKAGEWKYGYNTFNIDVTPYIYKDGRENTLAVRLENLDQSSRWYPGAGIYRPVTLVMTGNTALEQWGINVHTLSIDKELRRATVEFCADVTNYEGHQLTAKFEVKSAENGKTIATVTAGVAKDGKAKCVKTLSGVNFWSPEEPHLYNLCVSLVDIGENGERRDVVDHKTIKTGFRTIEVTPEKGFALNGESRKIKGVCLHHDLGMLGAAINKAALAHQLRLLKSMGCDAIRTSHNMPSQWQMQLCDSLGMMVMAESFDEWKHPKCKNGYNRFYTEWVDRDLTNLVLANRLHPSIVMWSIGNEIPEQGMKEGAKMTRHMQDIIHRLDHTRPVTAGMDRIDNALSTGYAQVVDIPGMNYRTHKYEMAYEKLGQGFVLGSETASTVSSRGVYKFPVTDEKQKTYEDGQCSSYDLTACSWSNIPEDDWILQDDKPWVIGEFVWTGFDYLGEPSPYDEYWPSRSSYFGIFDLAGLPKDRYYLYRSHWNTSEATIHLLPHWTWSGRESEATPVYCYTNYPSAELFVNGKSQGRISKNPAQLADRYRLRWNNVKYEPGELRVVVYDAQGKIAGEKSVKTAGKPDHIELVADRGTTGEIKSYADMQPTDNPTFFALNEPLKADGEDMAFIAVRIVDKDGNPCPEASNQLSFKVSGAGTFKGVCNGDATSLEVFTQPTMKTFNGELVLGVQTQKTPGDIVVKVSGKGLKSATLTLKSQN